MPDLPREGRGRGVVSFGRRGMGKIYGLQASSGNRSIGSDHRLRRLRSPPAAPRALPHPRPQPAQVCASPEGVPRHRKLGRRGGRIVNVTSRRECGVESLTADLVRTTRKSFRQAPVSLAAAAAGISARHQWPDQHVAQIRCGGAHETGPASFTPRHRAPRVIAVRVRGWAEGMRPMPSAAKFGAACGALPRHGPRPATGPPRVRWLDRARAPR